MVVLAIAEFNAGRSIEDSAISPRLLDQEDVAWLHERSRDRGAADLKSSRRGFRQKERFTIRVGIGIPIAVLEVAFHSYNDMTQRRTNTSVDQLVIDSHLLQEARV